MMPEGLLGVSRVIVSSDCVVRVHTHLQGIGHLQREAIALWAGRRTAETFFVTESIIPPQANMSSPDGLYVAVGSDALFALNKYLFERQLALIAQIHSHPGDAYHSDTDDAYPIATQLGAFSIVVPNFAVAPFDIRACAVYRLATSTEWELVEQKDVSRIFTLSRNDGDCSILL